MRRVVRVGKLDDEDVDPGEESMTHGQRMAELTGTRPELDYRASETPDSAAAELPAAWDVDPSPWSVGYEPIGATSIGVEAERKKASRFAQYRVPETRLALHQGGRHPSDGDQASRLATIDKKRIIQAYCSTLGIPRHLQADAVRGMLLLDLTVFGNQKGIEGIALLVIELVVDYERRYQPRDEEGSRMAEDPEFKYLVRSAGLIPGKMKLGQKVKSELITKGFFHTEATGLSPRIDADSDLE